MDIEKIKGLLGFTDDDKNAQIQFAIDDVEETILNYCHLDAVPTGLENTACRMVMDLYRAEGIGESATPIQVSSVSTGDTSTSFVNSSDSIKDTLLKNYEKQLRKYRKLGW